MLWIAFRGYDSPRWSMYRNHWNSDVFGPKFTDGNRASWEVVTARIRLIFRLSPVRTVGLQIPGDFWRSPPHVHYPWYQSRVPGRMEHHVFGYLKDLQWFYSINENREKCSNSNRKWSLAILFHQVVVLISTSKPENMSSKLSLKFEIWIFHFSGCDFCDLPLWFT